MRHLKLRFVIYIPSESQLCVFVFLTVELFVSMWDDEL